MSNEKVYPYIGKEGLHNSVVLFTSKGAGEVLRKGGTGDDIGYYTNDWNEGVFVNITREYLTNTYGKCESQEHAEFICKIGSREGFTVGIYTESDNWFCFSGGCLHFFESESHANDEDEKLIHLPLPPKEDEMESQLPKMNVKTEMPEIKQDKPIYTKEMFERGEYPLVGSIVSAMTLSSDRVKSEVLKVRNNGNFDVVAVMSLEENEDVYVHQLFYCALSDIMPIPTIEDDLKVWFDGYVDSTKTSSQYISEFLTKYKISAKEE